MIVYSKISAIVLPFILFLFVAVIVWGFQLREEKNSVLIKAENQYQRSFHELNENTEKLHHELAKLQVMNTQHAQRKGLANIWRLTTSAQGMQNFDLPANLKRKSGPDKPRKDSYSALVLGNWLTKIIIDMRSVTVEDNAETFTPMFIA